MGEPNTSTDLRKRAEAALVTTRTDVASMPAEDVQALVHELQVHQMELEIQNEELREAQLSLTESRDRYADLYEFAPVGYVTLDKEGVIEMANLTAATLLGLEREQLVNTKLSHHLAEPCQDDYHRRLHALFSADAKSSCEWEMHRKEESDRSFRMQSTPLADARGATVRCRVALVDVSELRQAEAEIRVLNTQLEKRVTERTHQLKEVSDELDKSGVALHDTDKRLSSLLDHVDVLIGEWVLPGLNLRFISKQAERLFGYPLEKWSDLKFWAEELMHPEDQHWTLAFCQEEVAAGRDHDFEYRVITGKGETRWIHEYVHLAAGAGSEPDRLVCVLVDVTKEKRAEAALKRSHDQLEQRVRERTAELERAQEELVRQERLATLGQLAGGVAHEIRNPLAVIRNNVYFFEATQKEPDEETKSSFEEIYRAMESTEHIVQELLDYARDPKPNENHFTLQEIIEDALNSREIPVNVQLGQRHEDLTVACCGDRNQMGRILGNLVSNALDEMLEGGSLTIDSRVSDDTVTVSVTDTGKGITEENLARVFEPLHTGKAKGIGLGLAISKRYAELNNASVSVKSEFGKGACFSLRLKIAKDVDSRDVS